MKLTTTRVAALALLLAAGAAAAADPYDPPAAYYNAASATDGATLKTQVRTILNSGTQYYNYGAARYELDDIDQDPSRPSNVILTYDGRSVSGAWDSGATWNREHTWPDSLGLGGSGTDYSDLHMLRPCTPSVNGARGNKAFGTAGGRWDPNQYGKRYRGEMARICFYMSTRFSHLNLTVVGTPSELIDWHYAEMPDQEDRIRNQRVYDRQRNRNAFVDRPEWVWAIFGTGPSDAAITLPQGSATGANGSTLTLDLGRAIGTAGDVPVSVSVAKTGAAPTSWRVTAAGDVSSPQAGPLQFGFARSGQQATVDATLQVGTEPGVYAGTLVIDNTEITSAGAGLGAQDADDVVEVRLTNLAPASPSLQPEGLVDAMLVDFGELDAGTTAAARPVVIFNNADAQLGAGLDLDGVSAAGDEDAFLASVPVFTGLPGGSSVTATITPATDVIGAHEAVYTITVSDEDVPGATQRTLTVTARSQVFCGADFDHSGASNVSDLLSFLGAYRNTAPRADRNGDGDINVSDLLSFLGAYRSGC